MFTSTDRLITLIFISSAAALTFALLNYFVAFSFAVSVLIILNFFLAYGREVRRKPILATLIIVLLALCVLFAGAATTHRPQEELKLIGGLPIGTAFFVYGIWPLGAVLCFLHILVFERSILPKRKVEKLIERFGRSEPER